MQDLARQNLKEKRNQFNCVQKPRVLRMASKEETARVKKPVSVRLKKPSMGNGRAPRPSKRSTMLAIASNLNFSTRKETLSNNFYKNNHVSNTLVGLKRGENISGQLQTVVIGNNLDLSPKPAYICHSTLFSFLSETPI